MSKFHHISVLPEETIKFLEPIPGGRYIDGTLGAGGHSRLILEAADNVELLGIDRDKSALAAAGENLKEFGDRVHLCHGIFAELGELAKHQGWGEVDGILLDIGVSSHQLDTAERGFSFRDDGPLDMRMDTTSPVSASTILNQAPEEELIRIFKKYGEVKRAKSVARAVIAFRKNKPFERTKEFADLAEKHDWITGRKKSSAMLYFQALRIAVNDELGNLEKALEDGLALLKKGGRMVVISFHSLEDRMVKQFFAEHATGCICPPDFPVCVCDHKPSVKILTRKVIVAGGEELCENGRAACAKLRAVEKL